MFSWNSLVFSMIQPMLAIWSLVPLPFLNPAWTSGSSWFTFVEAWLGEFWALLASVWDACNCVVLWTFFVVAFLWDWNENWPFPVLWSLLSFHICVFLFLFITFPFVFYFLLYFLLYFYLNIYISSVIH